jgi:hypothetical protein
MKGHILAIEADFDPDDPKNHPDTFLGYTGELRILGNLVCSELYPMLFLQSTSLKYLWQMAMEHPRKVCTGFAVPVLIERWRGERNIFGRLWHWSWRWIANSNFPYSRAWRINMAVGMVVAFPCALFICSKLGI